MSRSPKISVWSTGGVQTPERLDFWASVLSSQVVPMSVRSDHAGEQFEARIEATRFGPIEVLHMTGSAQGVIRDTHDVARSDQRSLHLLVGRRCSWTLKHRGSELLRPGDACLVDTRYTHDLNIATRYDLINIQMTPTWLANWGANFDALVGRRISCGTGWGRALSGYVTQLLPDFVVDAPLPQSLLLDQLGALLALVASERSSNSTPFDHSETSLSDRICECIMQRFGEPHLTAAHVAASVNISVRTLHRALGGIGRTFGSVLLDIRSRTALKMLLSRGFDRLTIAEIGRRAGFTDASHFVRVMRRKTGKTPSQIRKTRDGS
jgi:AraC family transcriptional regulator, positive regulator of tynA and feaB